MFEKTLTHVIGVAITAVCAAILPAAPAIACDICADNTAEATHSQPKKAGIHLASDGLHTSATASEHAPIGVMGDHMHARGEWMLSYRFMRMEMKGNRIGTSSVSPETIVTTVANRFAGMPMQPANLRVVPTQMTMDMHMFGAMYAPTNRITLMVMTHFLEKEMDHITFDPGPGTNRIGTFTTKSEGFGDTALTALIRLYDDGLHHLHLNAGLSLPTGAIDEEDDVLAPNGATPLLRMPYAMQLGSGTFDLLPAVTYSAAAGAWNWGAQYRAEIRLEGENDEGYAFGDKHSVTAWGGYEWAPWISTSLRLTGTTQGEIDGTDPRIVAPVQTADPDNYGGDIIEASLGVNLIGVRGPLTDQRLALEATVPLYRDLNGPQMETDWSLTVGWQYAF